MKIAVTIILTPYHVLGRMGSLPRNSNKISGAYLAPIVFVNVKNLRGLRTLYWHSQLYDSIVRCIIDSLRIMMIHENYGEVCNRI